MTYIAIVDSPAYKWCNPFAKGMEHIRKRINEETNIAVMGLKTIGA
ncbi:MAG: hypothetical protein GY861_17315 [bacterium]|nr:hypothetical protein [bacterium]